MADKKNLRRRRYNLLQEDPHCWYCGTEVFYEYRTGHWKYKEMPDNFATIEHLHSKNGTTRARQNPNARVLACLRCNSDRSYWSDKLRVARERDACISTDR